MSVTFQMVFKWLQSIVSMVNCCSLSPSFVTYRFEHNALIVGLGFFFRFLKLWGLSREEMEILQKKR